ncbi:MAG: hypothetical protein FJY76_02070 [Candidatus Aenigmarchaeota archaeon]|nr:hypothetical protein [Candidatus Aenigmarchaeota archaeon]
MKRMKCQSVIGVLLVAVVVSVLLAGAIYFRVGTYQSLPRFSSCSEMAAAFAATQQARGYGAYGNAMPMMAATTGLGAPGAAKSESGADYSTTNVQVEGVDEADIVKTDGTYIYTISNSNAGYYGYGSAGMLTIAKAYPAESAAILSQTNFTNFTASEMFVSGNRLLVFGYSYIYGPGPVPAEAGSMPAIYPIYGGYQMTEAQLWDISDRAAPRLVRSVEFEGSYLASRLIGGNAYLVVNSYPRLYALYGTAGGAAGGSANDNSSIIPLYRDSMEGGSARPSCGCADISYLPPVDAESFITIASISMTDDNAPVNKEVTVGSGQNVYASQQNIYIADTQWGWQIMPLRADGGAESGEKTVVHRFSLDNGAIRYAGSGEVPGYVLNQFSMDEHNGYFRIATTIGHVSRSGEPSSSNNVYILDTGANMSITGRLEGIAPGEQIYSARFMGSRGYLVTFKKVDPFFVIDLTNPSSPQILGKLKIPGYSDYLHPYDENHIIGVGKETIEGDEQGTFAWYQGLKMAVFDVTDVSNPVEMHKIVIGDRGTDSEALRDHKAFLFDKNKNLLVIPITLAEIANKTGGVMEGEWPKYGDFVFQGAYVYELTLQNGFTLKGRVTHYDSDDAFQKSGYYFGGYGDNIRRSLYIGDVLYTVSNNKIKASALADLTELKTLVISNQTEAPYVMME